MNWDYIRKGRDLELMVERVQTVRTRFWVWVAGKLPLRYTNNDYWFPWNVLAEMQRLLDEDRPVRTAVLKAKWAQRWKEAEQAAYGIRFVRAIFDGLEQQGCPVSSDVRRKAYDQFHPNVVRPPKPVSIFDGFLLDSDE